MKYEAEIWYIGVSYDADFNYHIELRINQQN